MAEIHRFSSRRQRLDRSFLANRLKGAKSYKRIAGYFRSSIFELVGEEIADIVLFNTIDAHMVSRRLRKRLAVGQHPGNKTLTASEGHFTMRKSIRSLEVPYQTCARAGDGLP